MAGEFSSSSPRKYYDDHRFVNVTSSLDNNEGGQGGEGERNDWLEVDFMKCLGRGGYGDVYEARITAGPLEVVRRNAIKTKIFSFLIALFLVYTVPHSRAHALWPNARSSAARARSSGKKETGTPSPWKRQGRT